MIRLTTLGATDLRTADGHVLAPVLQQPRRFAVLLYLVLAQPRGFHRRDTLLGLFWPETPRERGSHNLSQTLHFLKVRLGDGVVERRGDEVGVFEGAILCDATAFEEALDRGDAEAALGLYAGDLLRGFHLDDAWEFVNWLDAERDRLRRRASAAAEALAARAETGGDKVAAAHWARRALEIAPHDEAALRRLVAALDATGDRAAAMQAFATFADRLRAEFGLEPSPETLALADRIRAREAADPDIVEAYAAAASGRPATAVAVEAAAREAPAAGAPTGSGTARARRPGWPAAAAAATILIVAAGYLAVTRGTAPPDPAGTGVPRVAVLYFNDDSRDANLGHIAAGLTSTLITQLGQVGALEVISLNGVRPFRGTDAPLETVVEQLGVSLVIGGSVAESDDRLRVTVELVDAATRAALASRTVERAAGELFALIDDVISEVGGFLRNAIGREIRVAEWRAGTRSEIAWRLVQEAEELRQRAGSLEARGDLAAARALMTRADRTLQEAAAEDPRWAEPLVMRALIATRRALLAYVFGGDADGSTADWLDRGAALADRAVAVDPASAAAHEARGSVLLRRWTLAAPPGAAADSLLAEAERTLRRAIERDSRRPRAEAELSLALFLRGEFDEARRAAERAIAVDAYLTDIRDITLRLFQASFELGDDDAAGRWCDEVRRLMPDSSPYAHCALVLLGWGRRPPDTRQALAVHAGAGSAESESARALSRASLSFLLAGSLARAGMPDSAVAVIERTRSWADPLDGAEEEAAAWVAAGRHDEALQALARLVEARPTLRARLARSRYFTPLRDEPSFRTLMGITRIGEPE
jgi:DNA-binding SARP family transcriptional activator/TolB-like protein